VIRRQAGSREPDGVLEETAHMAVFGQLPRAGLEESLAELPRALAYYASFGLTTVQDGAAGPEALALLREADRRGLLTLDVVAYRLWTPVGTSFPVDVQYGTYQGRVRLGGIKLMLDGSPQGKTAWLSQPYLVPPTGQPASYSGYPTLPPAVVTTAVTESLQRNVPVIAHANGDAAAEALIDAVRAARAATGRPGPLVVMIHAQTVRDDQLDRMGALGMIPSFFTGHTFYWGDWHRDQTLGLPRAERISPARSAIERGLAFTLHTDAPVVPPDMLRTLWSATTRRTRSGDILGPAQRIGTAEALAGLTINAARQYGEADRKGAIRPGLLADLVILSRDPLAVDPESLRDVQVVETISRGRTVHRAQ
jgi:predicted amidohydrolase YtcJ